jgi:soluble lytic murein transglycosylase-like protein
MLPRRVAKLNLLLLAVLVASPVAAQVPRDAVPYQRTLTGQARAVWGLDAPLATFGAQIHQESGWRIDARSKYAGGLAQFTPETAQWIGGLYPELARPDVFNPAWALGALVRYDKFLWEKNNGADSRCDRMAFTLVGYNGGQGNVQREKNAARLAGAAPGRWWGAVERFCLRRDDACLESRGYPERILRVLEPRYAGWGPRSC